jgi:hypothetical protein
MLRTLPLLLALLASPAAPTPAAPMAAVNYGNRFIPEDWMAADFYQDLCRWEGDPPMCRSPQEGVLRISLADVVNTSVLSARDRMLGWLNATIAEEDFANMSLEGVQVVRLPCGYWNWIELPEGTTPSGPETVDGFPLRQQYLQLQTIATPAEYLPFFERIFAFSAKHGLKVMLDLHGAPGSQNGEVHSGIVTGKGEAPAYYFQTDWNAQLAVEAITEMAKFGAAHSDALWGLELINEPHIQDKSSEGHAFLASYFTLAIAKAREHLDQSVPVLTTDWTYNMESWGDDVFPVDKHGVVIWDVHIYQGGEAANLAAAKALYWDDLKAIEKFERRGNRVIVGEWTLGMLPQQLNNPADRKAMAQFLVGHFATFAEGSAFWNWDMGWSFKDLDGEVGWNATFAAATTAFVGLRTWLNDGTMMLSADPETGKVQLASSMSQWEEWHKLEYSSNGTARVALQAWDGRWLSVAEDGVVSATATSHSQNEEFTPFFYGDNDGCAAALQASCGAHRRDVFACAQCAGGHQQQLRAAGCDNDKIAAWCAGPPPPPLDDEAWSSSFSGHLALRSCKCLQRSFWTGLWSSSAQRNHNRVLRRRRVGRLAQRSRGWDGHRDRQNTLQERRVHSGRAWVGSVINQRLLLELLWLLHRRSHRSLGGSRPNPENRSRSDPPKKRPENGWEGFPKAVLFMWATFYRPKTGPFTPPGLPSRYPRGPATSLGRPPPPLCHPQDAVQVAALGCGCYDSQYTKDQCTAQAQRSNARAPKNATVVAVCRRLIRAAEEMRTELHWVKVKGHSGEKATTRRTQGPTGRQMVARRMCPSPYMGFFTKCLRQRVRNTIRKSWPTAAKRAALRWERTMEVSAMQAAKRQRLDESADGRAEDLIEPNRPP